MQYQFCRTDVLQQVVTPLHDVEPLSLISILPSSYVCHGFGISVPAHEYNFWCHCEHVIGGETNGVVNKACCKSLAIDVIFGMFQNA